MLQLGAAHLGMGMCAAEVCAHFILPQEMQACCQLCPSPSNPAGLKKNSQDKQGVWRSFTNQRKGSFLLLLFSLLIF